MIVAAILLLAVARFTRQVRARRAAVGRLHGSRGRFERLERRLLPVGRSGDGTIVRCASLSTTHASMLVNLVVGQVDAGRGRSNRASDVLLRSSIRLLRRRHTSRRAALAKVLLNHFLNLKTGQVQLAMHLDVGLLHALRLEEADPRWSNYRQCVHLLSEFF